MSEVAERGFGLGDWVIKKKKTLPFLHLKGFFEWTGYFNTKYYLDEKKYRSYRNDTNVCL
ncbi:hypothetical protein [Lutimonas sp.]|uniref:hypothetical protein n=1 Tax=Lutimonas sp. TaxID=1872403 RepID=UPI003D9AFA2A